MVNMRRHTSPTSSLVVVCLLRKILISTWNRPRIRTRTTYLGGGMKTPPPLLTSHPGGEEANPSFLPSIQGHMRARGKDERMQGLINLKSIPPPSPTPPFKFTPVLRILSPPLITPTAFHKHTQKGMRTPFDQYRNGIFQLPPPRPPSP